MNEDNIEFQFYNLISAIDIDFLNVRKQMKLVFIPYMTKLKNMFWKSFFGWKIVKLQFFFIL